MAATAGATVQAAPAARARPGPVIEIEGLSKRYATRRRLREYLLRPRGREWVAAVRDVSFEVGEGEIVGLLGANGAGKTTLLKMLSTLVVPDAGRARVAGLDVCTDAPQVRRIVASVPADERSLEWRLSARENLRFFGTLLGLRADRLAREVTHSLAAVGLEGTGDAMVGTFSSGQRQRLLIARALLASPRVLLLDEPTRSLDPIAALTFRRFIREELVGQQRRTILIATHNPDEALELCDRLVVMHQGRLLAFGTTDEIAARVSVERYRVWTRDPEHPLLRALRSASPTPPVVEADPATGQVMVEFSPAESVDDPGDILASLVHGGAHVARFERTPVRLPDLLHDVLARYAGSSDHA